MLERRVLKTIYPVPIKCLQQPKVAFAYWILVIHALVYTRIGRRGIGWNDGITIRQCRTVPWPGTLGSS